MTSDPPHPVTDESRSATLNRGCLLGAGFAVAAALVAACLVGGVFVALGLEASERRRAEDDALRARCVERLRLVALGSGLYVNDPVGPGGATGHCAHAGTGAGATAPGEVGEAFALLIRTACIDDPEALICPASFDLPAPLGDRAAFGFADDDVRTSAEFSFGWIAAALDARSADARTIVSADRSVGDPRPPADGAHLIRNHRGGRNVLRFDGTVEFVSAADERDRAEASAALAGLHLADRP